MKTYDDKPQAVLAAEKKQSNDDDILLRRVAAGERWAFEALYRRYTPSLLWYLHTHIRQADLVEEVCHEVLLEVWQQAAQFRHDSRVSTWVFEMAQRLARKANTKAWAQEPEPASLTDARSNEADPARDLERQKQLRMVSRGVDCLPITLRTTLRLRYYQDYTHRQIAAEMGCTEDTVNRRLRQGRRYLAAAMRCPPAIDVQSRSPRAS